MKRLISAVLCIVVLVSITLAGGPMLAKGNTLAPELQAVLDYIDNTVEITQNPDGSTTYSMPPLYAAPTLENQQAFRTAPVVATAAAFGAGAHADYSYTTGQTHTWLPLEQHYYYSLLPAEWKEYYRQIDTAVNNLEAKTSETSFNLGEDRRYYIYYLYMFDHPEHFYLANNCTIYNSGHSYHLFLHYAVGNGVGEFCGYGYALSEINDELRAKIRNKKATFDAKVAKVTATIPTNAPDIIKERLIYDYILKSSFYNLSAKWDGFAEDNWTAYGILANGYGVCESYAEAFQTLCGAVGVLCTGVVGDAGGGHKWNAVKIDNEWYMCDITFDDPLGNDPEDVYHYYFNQTSQWFTEHGHHWHSSNWEGCFSVLTYPECNGTAYSNQNFTALYGNEGNGYHCFSNACDTTCNNCSYTRQASSHVYDNVADPDCNVCHAQKKGWVLIDYKWYLFENSVMVRNAWRRDSIGWVYLGSNGAMLTDSWCKDSQGWCFVGPDGYAVTNCWKRDSYGWIWLNAQGSMAKNTWVQDGGLWYFVDANGYMESNTWKRDSIGWVYLGSNGAMLTNSWCKDSKGWCYVGPDGYAVTNCWKRDSIGWIWLDENGSMTKSKWLQDGNDWYYLDANGYMVTGTHRIGGKYYTFKSNGVWTGK